MIEKNRNNNFKFDDGVAAKSSDIMTTVMKSQHDYKGNPNEIRQTLDPSIKKDLRQHHFSMGNHPIEY